MRWTRRSKLVAVSLLVILLVSLSALVSVAAEDNEGTLIVGTTNFPSSNNPFVEYSTVYWGLYLSIYDGLYRIGPGEEVVPNIAKSVESSEDLKTYTVHLRDDFVFHDGEPVTAYDGEFSYNFIIENELGFFTQYTDPVESVEATGKYTLKVYCKQPMGSAWLKNNTFLWVPFLPRHVWEGTSKEEALKGGALTEEQRIASGPLKWAEFKSGELLRLEAFEEANRKMSIDKLVVQAYANSSTMVEDLRAGNIDIVTSIPEKAAPTLEKVPQVSLKALPAIWLDDIIFNSWSDAYEQGKKEHPHPALENVELRRALAWTFDTKMATQIAHGKYGTPNPINAYVPTAYGEFRNTSLQPIGFDLEKAKSILDEAGYKDTDGDGIRETSDGLPLEFDVWIPASQSYEVDVAELWAQWAKKAGVNLNVSAMDGSTLWAKISPNGEFDIALWNWGGDPDVDFLLSVMTCGQAVEGGWSDCGYCNPQYDELYEKQKQATSFSERKEIVWDMQEILYEDMPYIVWVYYGGVSAYRNDRIKGDFSLVGASYGVLGREFLLSVTKS